jgi:hypothetical protein
MRNGRVGGNESLATGGRRVLVRLYWVSYTTLGKELRPLFPPFSRPGVLPFAFYSVTFPSFLDITQQYNEAVNRGYSFLGVYFDTHYATYDDFGSTAKVFGLGGPAGDGILENNFALTLTPEPATLLLLALGGVAVMRRRR